MRDQNVSTQFRTSLRFSGGTLNNGITSFAGSDIYGLSSEVRINNNSSYTTGCGASISNASYSSTCDIAYGSATSYPQSTTENITGVFDMSGGAWEYVMGVFANSDGTLWSGNDTSWNSGFNGLLGENGISYTSGIDFPEEKYYNVYKARSGTTISALTACNEAYCYGHGLSEVNNWYDDNVGFVSSNSPWLVRGGSYNNGSIAGSFYLYSYLGSSGSKLSFRSILTIP